MKFSTYIHSRFSQNMVFGPSKTPRPFEIRTQDFKNLLISLIWPSNKKISKLAPREQRANFYILYAYRARQVEFIFFEIYLTVAFFWFYDVSRHVNSRKGASPVFIVLPWGENGCDRMTVIPSRDGMTLFGPQILQEYDILTAPNVIFHHFIYMWDSLAR